MRSCIVGDDSAGRDANAATRARVAQCNLWLGCNATSGLHFDGLDNVIVNAGPGEKLVHLYSPWLTREL